MGLLDNTTHKAYYQGNNLGGYQFTSLDHIISQFEIAYVGENKIIPKANRADIAFHAQRALQELSFDTFKSIKSQQIDLPPTLVMPIPHDYVNYTKISEVDSAGIKHVLYPVKETSNPFQVRQEESGEYSFPSADEMIINNGFDNVTSNNPDSFTVLAAGGNYGANFQSTLGIDDGALKFCYVSKTAFGGSSQIGAIYQPIDVSQITGFVSISADGVVDEITYTNSLGTTGTASSTIRFGLTATEPNTANLNRVTNPDFINENSILSSTDIFEIVNKDGDPAFIEWSGTENATKSLENIDVTLYDTIYVLALSFVDFSGTPPQNGFSLKPESNPNGAPVNGTIESKKNINSIDNISVTNTLASNFLQANVGNEKESSTWNNYKAHTPSENNTNDYQDYQNDIYWPNEGKRYGLDPKHAQINGSFYIDQRLGRIHFSSNISGKTVILDYISDSLGTDAEMQVHKFAEEAMYKCIAYAMLSTSNYGQGLVRRLKRERFAAIRNAKLRLSNIKIEELTQILRGKSKQIKH